MGIMSRSIRLFEEFEDYPIWNESISSSMSAVPFQVRGWPSLCGEHLPRFSLQRLNKEGFSAVMLAIRYIRNTGSGNRSPTSAKFGYGTNSNVGTKFSSRLSFQLLPTPSLPSYCTITTNIVSK